MVLLPSRSNELARSIEEAAALSFFRTAASKSARRVEVEEVDAVGLLLDSGSAEVHKSSESGCSFRLREDLMRGREATAAAEGEGKLQDE